MCDIDYPLVIEHGYGKYMKIIENSNLVCWILLIYPSSIDSMVQNHPSVPSILLRVTCLVHQVLLADAADAGNGGPGVRQELERLRNTSGSSGSSGVVSPRIFRCSPWKRMKKSGEWIQPGKIEGGTHRICPKNWWLKPWRNEHRGIFALEHGGCRMDSRSRSGCWFQPNGIFVMI